MCLFVCCFTSLVNSYGHGGTVSSLNHTLTWASYCTFLSFVFNDIVYNLYFKIELILLLLEAGDIELNPGILLIALFLFYKAILEVYALN